MSMHLVTGYAGESHITAKNDAALYRHLFGVDKTDGEVKRYAFPFNTDNDFVPTIEGDTIHIAKGYAMWQGRIIENDGQIDITPAAGSEGYNRRDIIYFAYSQDSTTGVESIELKIRAGEPTTGKGKYPDVTEALIDDNSYAEGMFLYVELTGTEITKVTFPQAACMYSDEYCQGLKYKVNKESGKGLSTNDFDTYAYLKVRGIAGTVEDDPDAGTTKPQRQTIIGNDNWDTIGESELLNVQIGDNLKATHDNQTVFGRYNEDGDNLLEVGNGNMDTNRNNAMELDREGNLILDGGVETGKGSTFGASVTVQNPTAGGDDLNVTVQDSANVFATKIEPQQVTVGGNGILAEYGKAGIKVTKQGTENTLTLPDKTDTLAVQEDVDSINENLSDNSYGENAGGKNLVQSITYGSGCTETDEYYGFHDIWTSTTKSVFLNTNISQGATFTLSLSCKSSTADDLYYNLYYSDGTSLSSQRLGYLTTDYATKTVTLTASKNITKIALGINHSEYTAYLKKGTAQIELGSSATDYEPYIESNYQLTEDVTDINNSLSTLNTFVSARSESYMGYTEGSNNLTFDMSNNANGVYIVYAKNTAGTEYRNVNFEVIAKGTTAAVSLYAKATGTTITDLSVNFYAGAWYSGVYICKIA